MSDTVSSKGRSVYLTADEVEWIACTMSNQDAFEDEKEEKISRSIHDKMRRAMYVHSKP